MIYSSICVLALCANRRSCFSYHHPVGCYLMYFNANLSFIIHFQAFSLSSSLRPHGDFLEISARGSITLKEGMMVSFMKCRRGHQLKVFKKANYMLFSSSGLNFSTYCKQEHSFLLLSLRVLGLANSKSWK